MQLFVGDNNITIKLSASDTWNWARRAGNSWPCSTLEDKRLVAEFDDNGLCDLTVNGRDDFDEIDSHELNAIVADHLRDRINSDHPMHFGLIGQFD